MQAASPQDAWAETVKANTAGWLTRLEESVSVSANGAYRVDLHEVTTLSSGDVNRLIRIRTTLQQQGGQLVLANVQGVLREIFVVTRLDRTFELPEDANL